MQNVNIKLLRVLATVLGLCYGTGFLDGVYKWGLGNGFYTTLGVVELVTLVWLLIMAYAKRSTTCVGGCTDCNSKEC